MARNLTESIRISLLTKTRLEDLKGVKTYDSYITKMLDYFEQTGYNPRHAAKNPAAQVEKRVEDLIKIIKSQERDLLKPLFSKVMDGQSESGNKEQLIRLANENNKLRTELQQTREEYTNNNEAQQYKDKLKSLCNLIYDQCDRKRFNTVALGSDLKVTPSFFEQLQKKVREEYDPSPKD